eukprot:jgi/Undpi1/5821/HiC_scaffold_2.g01095.m1
MCLRGRSESFLPRAPSTAPRRAARGEIAVTGFGPGSVGLRLSSTIDADSRVDAMESVAELKGRLLKRAAGVNRGLNCREEEQKEFVDIIERLEAQNPNTTPNYGFSDGTSILSGEWKLIFTSALDVLSLGLLPGIDVGQVFQNISEDGTEIANIVDLQPKAAPVFERFMGITSARLKVLAASSVEGDRRITLSFRSSQYSPQTLLGRDVSATLPPLKFSLPQIPGAGWVDTTFIDDDIRVARAFGGNLFVLARV